MGIRFNRWALLGNGNWKQTDNNIYRYAYIGRVFPLVAGRAIPRLFGDHFLCLDYM